MKIPFKEYGSGKPMVLLHAFPLTREMWQPQIEALTSSAGSCRVILPDLRGFGENTNFADINTMEDLAKDIAELLESLKIEKAVIGGLSMGGYVLFNLYRLFPQLFAAMILADTNCGADTEEKRRARYDLIKKIEIDGAAALIENMLPNLLADETKTNNPELVKTLEEKFFSVVNPQGAIAALRGMAAREDHCQRLDSIDVPTLLIFGEKDQVTNLETAEKMHAKIKNSILAKIPNAGHYSNLEQPETFTQALLDFVGSIEI